MTIKQFEYKPLSHYSYAIISEGKMAVIDPERNPQQYYDLAKANNAEIVAVFETHPHADFVSSHLQIHSETGAKIYISKKLGAEYPHETFDEGNSLLLGKIEITAINTPGHSPDSITIVAKYKEEIVLFTGDTLFVGDVGRPDLREKVGNITAKREELAAMMYDTVTEKFSNLPDKAVIFPAHGAGSLCGKNLSDAASTTLGEERKNNWAFKEQTKEEFISTILDGQPIIPAYFGFDVDLNKKGAQNPENFIKNMSFNERTTSDGLVIDVRPEDAFKKNHLKGSINIQAASKTSKFETWLGTIIKPNEDFTIVVGNIEDKENILERIAKIGFETQVKQVITLAEDKQIEMGKLNLEQFKKNPENFTIVDVRNQTEIDASQFFKNALAHPLGDLRETAKNIPTDKNIVVHCAGGYRSAAGSSIIENIFPDLKVFDLGDDIEQFEKINN